MLILVIFNLIIYIYFNCCVLLDVHIQSSDCKYKLTYLLKKAYERGYRAPQYLRMGGAGTGIESL